MKNIIEILGERLPEFARKLEKQLQEKYEITGLQFQLNSRFNLYSLDCTDVINGFVLVYGDNFSEVLEEFKKQLTPHSKVRKHKIAKAKRLMAEATK